MNEQLQAVGGGAAPPVSPGAPSGRIPPWFLLLFAAVALVGPNGYYLYAVARDPSLNLTAWSHPVAVVFMVEALMLLGLFLGYVYVRTRSWGQVGLYLLLAMVGSLAFSLPVFWYRQSRHGPSA